MRPGGALLIIYGAALAALSRTRRVASLWTVVATALDIGWVIGSAALLAFHDTPNAAIVVAPSVFVLLFAGLQLLGLRRSIFTKGIGRFALQREVRASADRAWSVISDVAGYAEVANNLRSSKIISGEGLGMIRKCEDNNGACWLETCTRWEPGEAYAFEVDASGPRYPFPLKTMRGDFEVDPIEPLRTVIRVRFTFTPRGGFMTELLLSLIFAARGDGLTGGILRRWANLIETSSASSPDRRMA
jgi:hypothetical protein